MDNFLFSGTAKTKQMIGRQEEFKRIEQAIFREDNACHIVLITGPGGMGKTRLIEEIEALGKQIAHQQDKVHKPIFSRLIEMADFRLHTRIQFLNNVRDALIGAKQVQFPNYDVAFHQYQNTLNQQTGRIHEAADRTEQAFLNDYLKFSKNQRIVWLIDTGERLSISGANWLLDQHLLQPEDLTFTTQRWLEQKIRENALPNTTIILASREEEGKLFLDLIRKALQANPLVKRTEIKLYPFNEAEVQSFFERLSQDWNEAKEKLEKTSQAWQIAEYMDYIAKDHNRIKVLHLYTAGQPVRLSLYTDLIIEGKKIPSRLEQSYEDAIKGLDITNKEQFTREILQAQQDIEREFINLLFGKPDPYAEILTTLVRAERDISLDQLCFALYSPPNALPGRWKPEKTDINELKNNIENMRELSIVKSSIDGKITLQDEIYRIYSNSILQDDTDRKDELEARKSLYEKLLSWTNHELTELEQQRNEFQRDDDVKLRIETPGRALQADFPLLSDIEIHRRNQIRQRISELEIERMYYEMLLDPLLNFNNTYCKLVDQRWIANNEEGMAIAQAEAWRILNNHQAIKFAEMRLPTADTTERARQILLRASQQESVVYWLKLFIMRRAYERAIELSDAVELRVAQLPDEDDRRSWQHTFASAERACWREYARIIKGDQIDAAIKNIEPLIDTLVQLVDNDPQTPSSAEKKEGGFRGHPAETRLRRIIGVMYNVTGYGYATLGLFRQAISQYGRALNYVRDTNFRAQEATILNNLSRALSEIGRVERGRRLCAEGLELRRLEGAEHPIALSINTLALIDNDSFRPDESWEEAATAVAYFRRLNDERGLGLGLIQLGEALRRLANQERAGRQIAEPIERIYDQSERALSEALALFNKTQENPRLIEVYNELGCLFRDRVRYLPNPSPDQRQRYYRDAVYYLEKAIDLSESVSLKRLQIDTTVNLAWTHYYFSRDKSFEHKRLDLVDQSLNHAMHLIPEDATSFNNISDILPMRDDSYIFYHLSKVYSLRGRMVMDNLGHLSNPKHKLDDEDRNNLKKGAEYFVRALGYAQLFSPRSIALSVVYDALYNYIKSFCREHIETFYQYQRKERERYDMNRIKIQDFSNLDDFMRECFGISWKESDTDAATH